MDAWKRVLVSPDTPIREALRTLDEGGLRLVLVVDQDQKLCGIMTDGDIRRALLNRVDLTGPVTSVMNAKPVTMHANVDRDVIRSVMEQRVLLHLPLVNENNELIGLETYQEMFAGPQRDNWVCLMAGGFGTRLGGLTKDRPKPMLPVNGKPILEAIIENFVSAGFRRFYISLHYLGNQIRDHFGDGSRWNISIRYIEEQTPLGTCGALGLLPDTGSLPLIVMNGDVLTRLDVNALLDSHVQNDVGMTLCVTEYDMQVPYGVVTGKDSLVTAIVEKPVHKFFVNAGIYVISQDVVERTRPARRLDMPDLVKGLIESNRKVSMFPIHEYWLDIGRPDDFERAQENKPR